jgi:hypothetical protein
MILFIFLVLFSVISLSVFAVTPNIELTPPIQSVTIGNQATINVVVEDVTNLKNANIVLEFDASKLQYVSSTAGSFIPNSFLFEQNIDNIDGSISLAIIAALGDSNYASGSGTIMTVIFERITSGNTNITFGATELKDKDNNIIAHTSGSGCSFVGCIGDFGSAGGGPPDGVVDFEDLMIFALAYGSSPGDPNWNPACDIAGSGGSLTPDGVIDFEDLMIFALHYGEGCGCTLPPAPTLSDLGNSLQSPATYTVSWSEVSEAASYVLQEATSSNFSGATSYPLSGTSRSFSHTVSSDTTYYYRVTAVNSCGQSGWSNVENIKIEGVPSEGAKWTIMVYIDGDNSLDSYAWDDLSELESVSSTDEINIVAQLDAYYSCSGTFRYYITGAAPGASYPWYSDDIVQTLPEQNMANPATLTSFVNWATTNYPADKYLLVLWNHGGGWKEYDILTKGVIWDDTSGDFMTMAELVQGLNGINEKIDIIGFDACLMQMAEVAYEIYGLTNVPNYMVGSEASEWGDGWPYDDILADLLANPGMTDTVLCETIVNDFINYCGTEGTLSTLDFSAGTYDTYTALNSFATALMESSYQNEIATARSSAQSYSYSSGFRCKDIYDFAERIKNSVPDCQSEALAVMNQVNDLVLFEAHTGSGVANSHGLSIYLPDNAGEYDSDYNDLQFAIDTQWDEFLQGEGGGVVPPSSSVYRAFLVGVGNYQYFPDANGNIDLPSPPFDVNMMHDTLSHSGSGFSSINELIDLQATKSAILNGIATAFSEADSDDVSYFYFSGHGLNSSGVSYLCPTDISYYSLLSSYISTNELESALNAIPGTKVVILECCYSGGFIGKQMQEEKTISNAQEFNDNVINVFLSRDLTGSQYKVLTSCLSSQLGVELIPAEGDPFGLFSGVLCEGCGYNYYTHPYFADGNENSEITLQEAYTYTYGMVNTIAAYLNDYYGWNIDQDTQVYPLNSNFIIIEE